VSNSERDIAKGIRAAKQGDFLQAMNFLTDAYAGGEFKSHNSKSVEGLSYYGLCLALVQKRYKEAIDVCKKCLTMNFFNPAHYANLARVYLAAAMRKKAIDTLEEGLRSFADDKQLLALRGELGVRGRPVVPFLERSNPVNVKLGRTRHARKAKPEADRSRETS
jgi:tetratricopeptide (TPR) repeat protein